MLRGSAWAARRDQAFALVEDPQQRRLADWRDQRTRRRAELAEKTARREAEFTALIPAIAAQVAAEVSAAVEAALRATRVGHHEGLNLAPTTTSTPTASVADDHDLNLAPATTSTTTRSVAANYDPTVTSPFSPSSPHALAVALVDSTPASSQAVSFLNELATPVLAVDLSTSMPGTAMATSTSTTPASVLTACAVRDGNLATRPLTTCSTICPGRAATSAVSMLVLTAASTPPTVSVAIVPDPVACIVSDKGNDTDDVNLTTATPITCSTECSEQENSDPSPVATSMMASMVLCEAAVTTACMVCGGCVYPVAQPVVIQATVPVDVVDCAPTMAAPSTDIMLHPRAPNPATTKPMSAVVLESDLIMVSPTTVSVVCLDPVPDVPAAVLTQATLKLVEQQLVCSCVNQLHPICSGMCSGFGCGPTHSVCLLPWDPGEKPVVLIDSTCSNDIDWGACDKQLDTNLSGSHVHDQKSGYAKHSVSNTWIVLKNQFDCAGPFSKQYLDCLTACATTYPAMCAALVPFEDSLLGSVAIVQNKSQPHLEVSESSYCSELMFEGVTHQGVEYFPGKIAWLLVGYSCGCSEQEESGNLIGNCRQHGEVKPRPLPWPSFEHDQDGWQQGQPPHQLLSTLLVNFDYSLQAWVVCYIDGTWVSRFGGLTYAEDTSSVHGCEMKNGFQHAKLWDPGGNHSRAWIFQWRLVLVNCKRRLGGVHSIEQQSPLKVQSYTSSSTFLAILNGRAKVQQHYVCTRAVIEAVQLINQQSSSNHAMIWRNRAAWVDHRATITTVWSIQPLKLVRRSNQGGTFLESFPSLVSVVLHGGELQLSWDPGGRQLFGFFTQAEAIGGSNAAAPAYYRCHRVDQDHHLNIFHDQVQIVTDHYFGVLLEQVGDVGYLNLVKVCLDYGTHRDLGEVMKHQVPWDPGGSTWHRLEVKPKFKERGMLATFATLPWAGPWADTIGPGLLGNDVRQLLQIQGKWLTNDSAWIRTASASSAYVSSFL